MGKKKRNIRCSHIFVSIEIYHFINVVNTFLFITHEFIYFMLTYSSKCQLFTAFYVYVLLYLLLMNLINNNVKENFNIMVKKKIRFVTKY